MAHALATAQRAAAASTCSCSAHSADSTTQSTTQLQAVHARLIASQRKNALLRQMLKGSWPVVVADAMVSRLIIDFGAVAFQTLPTLFFELNSNVPAPLASLHSGKLVQLLQARRLQLVLSLAHFYRSFVLQTIAQWSLCLAPNVLPSASDQFLMTHQIGEGLRALREARDTAAARVRRLLQNYPGAAIASASAAAADERKLSAPAQDEARLLCSISDAITVRSPPPCLGSLPHSCSCPLALQSVSTEAYALDAVLNAVRDQLSWTQSLRKSLTALATSSLKS